MSATGAAQRTGRPPRRVLGRRAVRLDARSLARSEEHTSELQSRQYLVCRLLLEITKNTARSLAFTITPTASDGISGIVHWSCAVQSRTFFLVREQPQILPLLDPVSPLTLTHHI